MKNQSWNLTSNMKAAAHSQGTLFSGGTQERTDTSRYPRGYTPERQEQVRSALSKTSLPAGRSGRLMQDAIARSRLPASALSGIKSIGEMPKDNAALGYYYPNKKAITVVPGTTHDRAAGRLASFSSVPGTAMLHAYAEQNLIHEIGHHIDHQTNRSRHVATQLVRSGEDRDALTSGGRSFKGLAEGFADRVALDNYRQDPRDESKRGPLKLSSNTYAGRGLAKEMPTYWKGANLLPPKKRDIPSRPDILQGKLF